MKNSTPSAASLLNLALRVVRHSPSAVERAAAAHAARVLLGPVRADELTLTEVMTSIRQRLSHADVVRHLLVALRLRSNPAKLAGGVERLAALAHHEEFFDSLRYVVFQMLETPAWHGAVREEWVRAALSLAPDHGLLAERILLGWLRLHDDSMPTWMCEVVEAQPELLGPCLPSSVRWRLHQAAPTPHGWQRLAGGPEQGNQILTPTSFGERLGQAIETLEAAMREEPSGLRRVVLEHWLVEIGGA